MNFQDIVSFNFINVGDIHINLINVITVIFILLLTKYIYSLFSKLVVQYFRRIKVDSGRIFAITIFLKYIIYSVGLFVVLEYMGISLSIIWGGAAALLVGIGLGLQQVFNDLVSGIILLIEGSIDVDDVIEVEGTIGKVTHIGIRTSKVETFDQVSLLIPNSKLVGNHATNFNHSRTPTRFRVNVGVSYNSDIDVVTSLLKQVAEDHSDILSNPEPVVHFVDFGESSLDFSLLFFSNNYRRLEGIKSDVRYHIFRLLKENNIEIPYPQRDVWMKG